MIIYHNITEEYKKWLVVAYLVGQSVNEKAICWSKAL